METIKQNWLIILGAYVAWRFHLAAVAEVPLVFSMTTPTAYDRETLRARWSAENPSGISIPLPGGATATIDGSLVSIL